MAAPRGGHESTLRRVEVEAMRLAIFRVVFVFVLVLGACFGFSEDARAASSNGMGFVRSPWSRGASTEQALTCGNCQFNSNVVVNSWATSDVGRYWVRFPNLKPAAGARIVVHAGALNTPGATCAVTGRGWIGEDLTVNVDCRKNNTPIYTRFMVHVSVASGTQNVDRGFAGTVNGSLSSALSWSARGTTPLFARTGLGRYTFRFPDLASNWVGGNAVVTSALVSAECRTTSWGPAPAGGTQVLVTCQNSAGTYVDADLYLSFNNVGAWNGGTAFTWTNSLSGTNGTVTPQAFYTQNMGPVAPLSIYHTTSLPGTYIITFNTGKLNTATTFAKVTPWEGTGVCSLSELDENSARVVCVNPSTGAPLDNGFSFVAFSDNRAVTRGYRQIPITGTNFKSSSFDVGHGLICGEGAAGAYVGKVLCVPPASPGATGDVRVIGGGVVPGNGIKSIAIDNVDATTTRVLVLSNDNWVRVASGNLTQAWPTPFNLGTYTSHVQPVNTSGQAVSLKEITVVRTQGSTTTQLVGLTTGGVILTATQVGANWVWGTPPFLLPTGRTFKHISHGRYDLYVLQTDNGMLRVVTNEGYGGLNTLPANLAPIAMGGRAVLTNAGVSNGRYPCTTPADSSGFYNCAGDSSRMYMWESNNTGRAGYNFQWPTTNSADVLTSGQPFASIAPTIVDADMFEGNLGSFVAWQYNSRLYQSIP